MEDKKIEKKDLEPTFKKAEGKFESVGVQNGVCYIVVDGKRINCQAGEIIKVEVSKK